MLKRSLISLIIYFGASHHCRGSIIDQSNDTPAQFLYPTRSINTVPLGQEFTPQLPTLDFVEVWLRDLDTNPNPSAVFKAEIRRGTITGDLVATSLEAIAPDNLNQPPMLTMTRLEFPRAVPLIPGEVYVMHIQNISTVNNYSIQVVFNGAYSGGRAVIAGVTADDLDLRFAEGVNFFPGDFNHDNDVTKVDFDIWQLNFGREVPEHTLGNADATQFVDGADFLYWQRDLGRNVWQITAVPEPSGLALLAVGITGAAAVTALSLRGARRHFCGRP